VGTRSARQLLSSKAIDHLVILSRRPSDGSASAAALGASGAVSLEQLSVEAFGAALHGASVVLLAVPGPCRALAELSIRAGVPVVAVSDSTEEVRSLLELDQEARSRGVPVVVGAAMAPGLSCLLAAWLAPHLDELVELHVASLGTGGPACARRRHAALGEIVEEWRNGEWARKVASSGRELVWFPGRVGGADCYRVSRPDSLLLVQAFPAIGWVTARAAASRRDRMSSWLPMLRPPHPEGTVGAVRVEARGRRAGKAESLIVGAVGRPALLAGTVASVSALSAATGQLRAGVGGLASLASAPGELLAELHQRGVQLMVFEGANVTPAW
jgi:hypothetical protein